MKFLVFLLLFSMGYSQESELGEVVPTAVPAPEMESKVDQVNDDQSAEKSATDSEKKTEKKGLMARSKADLKMILAHFSDSEGAMIRRIHWKTDNQYTVDIYSKLRQCVRQDLKLDRVNNKVNFEAKVLPCD